MAAMNVAQDVEEAEALDNIKKVHRFRELFKGRFTTENAQTLLNHHNWDLQATAAFTLESCPEDLGKIIGKLAAVEPVLEDISQRDDVRNNKITTEVRQFSCEKCDNVWWTRVPVRKMVSECNKCLKKFDALARDEEWGWAVFECPCGNEFHGFGAIGKTESQCFSCKAGFCMPTRILPPQRRMGSKSSRVHSCTAPNCFNMSRPGDKKPLINLCVHPKSLTKQVVHPANPHASTGSTVSTFLTQDKKDVVYQRSSYQQSLADISETHEDR